MKYPRDLTGYGENKPRFLWPNKSVIAVQFVINYEEGGENNILHGDEGSEAFLSEIIGAESWKGQRHWNMESIYEYGARVGFWRLKDIFTNAKIPVTVYGVAEALARSPLQVRAMIDSGWEIASHGLKWIDYRDFSLKKEKEFFNKALELHEATTGAKPKGWYLGRCTSNTIKIACEYGNFDYISDSYADELPYWHHHKGTENLIVPYTLDANDMRFATSQGFNSGSQFYEYLKDTFDCLYHEGKMGYPKMMSIGLHCRLAGRPGRVQAIKKFIEYTQKHNKVWYAKRIDIAKFWKKTFPPSLFNNRPSEMNKLQFIKTFQNVFEHSKWIATKTYEKDLSEQMNSASGLHQFMCTNFRLANRKTKLDTLLAHPDLAGKLAEENKLTKESKLEQKSAGLNSLSDRQKKEFSNLNKSYRKNFGFPFILAVKNKNPDEILANIKIRQNSSLDIEFETACREVEKIALLRLKEIFGKL